MEKAHSEINGGVRRIGYWWPDKKEKDVSPEVVGKHLRQHNLELVKLDLSRPLAEQGPFAVIVHKLCDFLIRQLAGDKQAAFICEQFEALCASNPRMKVLDPFSSVKLLLDRNNQYRIVKNVLDALDERISVPPFVRLDAAEPDANVETVKALRLRYPLVCKPIVSQGSDAHRMCLVLNERGLRKLKTFPCVAQQFVPHGSVLYKVFIVGSAFQVVKRPSFKNIVEICTEDLIDFHSHDISKPAASSPLTDKETWLRPDGRGDSVNFTERMARVVEAIRGATGQTLCGIDVIAEEGTDQLFVIDVNNFPGYSGMDNFLYEFSQLLIDAANEAGDLAMQAPRRVNGSIMNT